MTTPTMLANAAAAGRRSLQPGYTDADRWTPRRLVEQAVRDAVFLGLGVPIGVGLFALFVTLVAVSTSLLVIAIGILPLLATFMLARLAAELERGRAQIVDARPLRATYPPLPRSLREVLPAVSEPRSWRDVAYAVVQFPVTLAAGILGFTGWAVSLVLVGTPLYYSSVEVGEVHLGGMVVDTLPEALLCTAIGIALIPLAFILARGLTLVELGVLRAFLDEPADLQARVREVEDTRAGAVEAADAELRRIERDLHDGAQARLVSVGLGIGMARERLATDPQAAAEYLDRAREETRLALTELRDLARGIAPAVLTDRGLRAAIESLVAGSPVPVSLEVELGERPPAPVERAAYFVVTEGLSNAGKHAGARTVRVHASRPGDRLLVRVTDDGAGGAAVVPGGGLDGLAKRVAALDGTFTLESPAGGPTILSVELPCAS